MLVSVACYLTPPICKLTCHIHVPQYRIYAHRIYAHRIYAHNTHGPTQTRYQSRGTVSCGNPRSPLCTTVVGVSKALMAGDQTGTIHIDVMYRSQRWRASRPGVVGEKGLATPAAGDGGDPTKRGVRGRSMSPEPARSGEEGRTNVPACIQPKHINGGKCCSAQLQDDCGCRQGLLAFNGPPVHAARHETACAFKSQLG